MSKTNVSENITIADDCRKKQCGGLNDSATIDDLVEAVYLENTATDSEEAVYLENIATDVTIIDSEAVDSENTTTIEVNFYASLGSILITVDSRENSMTAEINEEKNTSNLFKKSRSIEWSRRMMDVGDYSICNSNGLICLIERKSLADYVASFHDGRYKAQLERMKQVREVSKCFLYYIVEGKFMGMDVNVGNTPYKNIIASMRKHEIEDNIFFIRTVSKKDTMRNIRILAESFSSSSYGIIGSKEAMLVSKPDSTTSSIISIWRSSKIPLKAVMKLSSLYSIADWVRRRENNDISEKASTIGRCKNTNLSTIDSIPSFDSLCTKVQITKLLSVSDTSILSSFPKISESSAEYLLTQDSLINILTSTTSYTIKGRKIEKVLKGIRDLADKKIEVKI